MTNDLKLMAVAALARTPSRPCIEYQGRWIGWGEINAQAQAIQQALNASGVRETAPIAFIPRNRPWAIAALLALIAQGRNIQMIYGFQSAQGIARDIDRLQPAALVAEESDFSEDVCAALARCGGAGVALDETSAHAVPALEKARGQAAERTGAAEPQIEIFTSGTTGPPKQFAVSYNLIAQYHVRGSALPFLDDESTLKTPPALFYFPVGNISGIYSTVPPLLKGARGILLDRFSLEIWRQYIVQYRPPFAGIPPSFFQALLDADIPKEDLASLKFMTAGAAPLDAAVQRAFEDKYNMPILLSYGATEFGGPVTMMSLADREQFGQSKIGAVGRAIGGAQLRVVDPESGAELEPGKIGLLEVISPRIGPDWIRTADIGLIDEDGFLYHHGRADGAIVRGGFKILPETIENGLKRNPDVADAVVVGIPDRRLGQVPAAAIKLVRGAKPDEAALEAHLRQHVMSTHIPVRWLFCDDYPRTISAKIDRQGVRKLFESEPR